MFESFSEMDFNSIKKIYEELGLNTSSLNFTAQEHDWISQNPVVRVGIDPSAMPYEGIQDGEFKGIIADVLKEMSEVVGIEFQPVFVDSWQSTIELLESRELDPQET